jgi:hypothetical protein
MEGSICDFFPTFKIYNNEDRFNLKRVPSYTDRIIYKSGNMPNTMEPYLKLMNYDSNNLVKFSDHRPVFAQFLLKTNIQTGVP